ncbi:hypothetical protein SDC9_131905 [bioreactor metagenome]|uniref:Uncharacterized protein n=1 Tax=bioreactor metagenome TaxID=1076179 RepID=A0A645D6I9_9ZZZZ
MNFELGSIGTGGKFSQRAEVYIRSRLSGVSGAPVGMEIYESGAVRRSEGNIVARDSLGFWQNFPHRHGLVGKSSARCECDQKCNEPFQIIPHISLCFH